MSVDWSALSSSPPPTSLERTDYFLPTAKLHQTTCSPLPYPMYKAQSVVIDDILFVGGGIVNKNDVPSLLFKYNSKYDSWTTLPCCPVTNFGLTVVRSKPVLVGGRDIYSGGKPTSDCFVFEAQSDEWKKSIPAMSVARHSLTCSTNGSHIVACGGIKADGNEIKDVEIYEIAASKWYTATDMPFSGAMMSHQIINDTLYVASFDKSSIAYSYLSNIVISHKAQTYGYIPVFGDDIINLQWTHLKNPPLNNGSLINFKSSLAFVGRIRKRKNEMSTWGMTSQPQQYSNNIYLYSPFTSDWLVFATLDNTYHFPTTAILSNGDILIVGGCKGENDIAVGDVMKFLITKL